MSFRNQFPAKIYGFLFRKMGFSYTNVYTRTSVVHFFARIARKFEYLRNHVDLRDPASQESSWGCK